MDNETIECISEVRESKIPSQVKVVVVTYVFIPPAQSTYQMNIE